MITMHAHPRQTDGQTDKHHANSATIRSMNASRAKILAIPVLEKLRRPMPTRAELTDAHTHRISVI